MICILFENMIFINKKKIMNASNVRNWVKKNQVYLTLAIKFFGEIARTFFSVWGIGNS